MTRLPRWFRMTLALAGLALVGCPSLRVEWADYNPGNFAPMERFAFAPASKAPPRFTPAERETRLANRALAEAEMRSDLEAKGYVHDAAKADFFVHFVVGQQLAETEIPRDARRQGELDVWFVRKGETDRFWHGWASLTLYEQIDGTDEIKKAAVMVLQPVPPRR